jgi:hypothetical protein
MTEPMRRNAPLSPYRAFVVQFSDATQIEAGHMAGRVEHIVSGQAAHFQSLESLLTFFAHVLIKLQRDQSAEDLYGLC